MKLAAIAVSALVACQAAVAGTIVNFNTNMGSFQVELFDAAAPLTVQNFLTYVTDGDYDNSFIHRSVPGFIIQGGGFTFYDEYGASYVPTDPPVANEPGISNVRGTIAMAKLSGDPDSATSQWFINLADNSANLDYQNGGFTVFGQVLGDGMDIIDAIAALPTYDATGGDPYSPFGALPLKDYAGGDITTGHLVMISSVDVPEPASLALLAAGALALARKRRRA